MIYTIGYGNSNPEDMLTTLKNKGVQYLVDVRSRPYSRYRPELNMPRLRTRASEYGLSYIFIGNLGGKPGETSRLHRSAEP